MAARPDLPRIKPENEPSYVNHTAGLYADLGQMLGGLLDAVCKSHVWRPVTFAAGGMLGAYKGKQEQQDEKQHGRVVKDPSIWNVGWFSGSALGTLIALPVAMLAHKTGGAAAAEVIMAVGGVGGMLVMPIVRKQELQRDFDKAMAIRKAELAELKALRQERAKAQTVYKDSVTPEESASLADKQSHKPSHEDALRAERSEPAAHAPTI